MGRFHPTKNLIYERLSSRSFWTVPHRLKEFTMDLNTDSRPAGAGGDWDYRP